MIKLKIAVRAGHNFQSPGASALIDETTEDRKVKDSVIKYLKQLGHDVLDVTPGNMGTNEELSYGVAKANAWGAKLFISIHFNKAYNSYNGAIGTEAWVYSKSDNITLDEEVALRIVNDISNLGFKNRGVKENKEFYELKNTKMASVIVEVCFVEATEDVSLYKRLGPDVIGKTIAEAISNIKINNSKGETDMKKIVTFYGDADVFAAVMVAQKNRCPLMKVADYAVSGIKADEVIQIGGKAEDTNRYVSFKNAAKLV